MEKVIVKTVNGVQVPFVHRDGKLKQAAVVDGSLVIEKVKTGGKHMVQVLTVKQYEGRIGGLKKAANRVDPQPIDRRSRTQKQKDIIEEIIADAGPVGIAPLGILLKLCEWDMRSLFVSEQEQANLKDDEAKRKAAKSLLRKMQRYAEAVAVPVPVKGSTMPKMTHRAFL